MQITDFVNKKEMQLLSRESNLAAEQRTNGEFVEGVNNVKRRKK